MTRPLPVVLAALALAACQPYPGEFPPEVHAGAAPLASHHAGAAPHVEADVAPRPPDPYRSYNFRLVMGGMPVAAFTRASGFTRTTPTTTFRGGAQPVLMPGQPDQPPITLSRGITYDAAFVAWCGQLWMYPNTRQPGNEVSLADFRKDLRLELYDAAGLKVLAYDIAKAWPSRFEALPELDGNGTATAIAALELQHLGVARDTSVAEPTEPSFTLP